MTEQTEKVLCVEMTPSFAKSMIALMNSLVIFLPQLAPKGADISQHLAGLEILRDTIQDALNKEGS